MIGLLNPRARSDTSTRNKFQSAGRMIGLLNARRQGDRVHVAHVSIRRADDWAFEPPQTMPKDKHPPLFQSAGRMIGLLNPYDGEQRAGGIPVSIRRADDWAFEPRRCYCGGADCPRVSIRRADDWAFEPRAIR